MTLRRKGLSGVDEYENKLVKENENNKRSRKTENGEALNVWFLEVTGNGENENDFHRSEVRIFFHFFSFSPITLRSVTTGVLLDILSDMGRND